MAYFLTKRIPVFAIILLMILWLDAGIKPQTAAAQATEENAPEENVFEENTSFSFRGFFKRIFRDDEWEDPPTISRGDLCLLTPARPGEETVVWHQNPVFVWQTETGAVARMEVVDSVTNAVIWEYEPFPEQMSVTYTGETLQAGRSYFWRVYENNNLTAPTVFPPFTIMSAVHRQLIANGIAVAESKVEGEVQSAIARTEYLALRGLPGDALQSLFLIESIDETLVAARQETVDRLCD